MNRLTPAAGLEARVAMLQALADLAKADGLRCGARALVQVAGRRRTIPVAEVLTAARALLQQAEDLDEAARDASPHVAALKRGRA